MKRFVTIAAILFASSVLAAEQGAMPATPAHGAVHGSQTEPSTPAQPTAKPAKKTTHKKVAHKKAEKPAAEVTPSTK